MTESGRPQREHALVPPSALRPAVNPYCRWIYDHPTHLLPEPTPELLAARRAAAPRARRLIVDLGSGSGNFLLHLGREFPSDHLVGFELRFKRLVKSARKLEKLALPNVWLLREGAENFDAYFPPGSVDVLCVNFPDPWPKRSQWKKRLIAPAMLSRMEEVLKDGGLLRLKTDHSGYFLHSLALLRNRPRWKIRGISNDLHRYGPPGLHVQTEFERLFIGKGKAIFYLVVEKTGEGA
ncbi:MAG: methyltransferase domain-containing protein [SAR324 cluster bacterium]|nr:methyltransferase domain-containing protein [SAR324 cluster bacterium]